MSGLWGRACGWLRRMGDDRRSASAGAADAHPPIERISSSVAHMGAPLAMLSLALAVLLGSSPAASQTNVDAPIQFRPSLAAVRTPASVTLDGRLDEPVWKEAPPATGLLQIEPDPGAPAAGHTEARVVFDEDAVYVAMRMYDPAPDSIVGPFLRRDDEGVSDRAYVCLDTRYDRRTAFCFGLNPKAIQMDATIKQDAVWDVAWDAVWEGAARVDSLGWVAEFRLPFSQLPFTAPDLPSGNRSDRGLTWGVSFLRDWIRRGESSTWTPRWRGLAGWVSHFNDLTGIAIPDSHKRWEVAPFLVASSSFVSGSSAPSRNASAVSASIGADLSLGLTHGFTLTGAVRPDFGQIEADPSQVNLTTFETFYPEKRPLFVEGAEFFQFGSRLHLLTRGNGFASESPFYTRRVGRSPRGSLPDTVLPIEQPEATSIHTAAKLTGRTQRGWTVGLLSAWTGPEHATLRYPGSSTDDEVRVEPASGIAVARISKEGRGGKSAAGLLATFVAHPQSGASPYVQTLDQAVVGGVDFRHRFGGDRFEVDGFLLGSRIEGTSSAVRATALAPPHNFGRADAHHLDAEHFEGGMQGMSAEGRLAKIGGAWTWSARGRVVTPGFDMNELGFQRNADWALLFGTLEYHRTMAEGRLRQFRVGSDNLGFGWSSAGELRAAVVNGFLAFDLRNYWGGMASVDYELAALSTELLRGGPALLMPPRVNWWVGLYSDTRRTMRLHVEGSGGFEPSIGSRSATVSAAGHGRLSEKLELSLSSLVSYREEAWAYVGTSIGHARRYILGRLSQRTADVTMRLDYSHSPTLTLQLYAQPFLSAGRYRDFREVMSPRAPTPSERVRTFDPRGVSRSSDRTRLLVDEDGDGSPDVTTANPDFRKMEFNLNAVFRWEFRPGSSLFVVWTQDQRYNDRDTRRPWKDVDLLLHAPSASVLAVKLTLRVGER